jgi:hypothetical protein
MTAVLLSIHVLAAIVLIGPITVAASLFPRYARAELADPGSGNAGVLYALHRISAVYSVAAVTVPVFGIATALQLGVLGDIWLQASMALTVVAAALLALVILPTQRRVVATLDGPPAPGEVLSRLAMYTGLFSLTWAVVVVLMIVRPGSSTGT